MELLQALIREHTGDRSWEEDPRVGLTMRDGILTITQTAKVHREIQDLLGRLGL